MSGSTGHLNRNLYIRLKLTKWPKTLGITSKNKKGISCLQVIFVLIWWNNRWYGSIYKEMELHMDCLTPGVLFHNVCSYKHQFCTKACACSRLVSQVHMMTRQNIKKKYIICQIPNKMVKQHAIPDSSLRNLKIYSSKGCRKTSQSWIKSICLAKHSEHNNSKYSNFQQMFTSHYGFLL